MTLAEYAEQQCFLGRRIHEHDGIYWEEVYPFYCKPAFFYKPINRDDARPSSLRSLCGYSHRVENPLQGNSVIPTMALDRSRLDDFSLQRLSSKKRNQVRRGMEKCIINQITDMEEYLDRMLEINISQAVRQEKGGVGVETPVTRFTVMADKWRLQMRREFTLRHREWWGAFYGDMLVAYMRIHQVDNILDIYQTKADSVYLGVYPMDALYFTILEKAASNPTCSLIVNSRPMHATLNHFKEAFLFRALELPFYFSNLKLFNLAKRMRLSLRRA